MPERHGSPPRNSRHCAFPRMRAASGPPSLFWLVRPSKADALHNLRLGIAASATKRRRRCAVHQRTEADLSFLIWGATATAPFQKRCQSRQVPSAGQTRLRDAPEVVPQTTVYSDITG